MHTIKMGQTGQNNESDKENEFIFLLNNNTNVFTCVLGSFQT